ncbi:MAG: hypothetical protein M2R45_04802 [Verrucomicrobia subdivision 3 bacterium]|nr:hypothetical protein [Limisphaerales bacterium]MCS1417447.1 hypothetical protein [Limisphaerales bacterium]
MPLDVGVGDGRLGWIGFWLNLRGHGVCHRLLGGGWSRPMDGARGEDSLRPVRTEMSMSEWGIMTKSNQSFCYLARR